MDTPAAPPLAARMTDLIWGYQRTKLVYVAAALGLADLLADGPLTAGDLAARTDTHPPSLERLLLALASHGLLAEGDDGRFALTPLGALLRSGTPDSLRAMALVEGGDLYPIWGDLLHCVRTGETAWEHLHGTTNWAYRAQHPDANARFNAYMGDLTRQKARALLASYPFPAEGTLVDVGGGDGTLLAAILGAYPGLRGVLFDLPHVAETARPVLAAAGVANRCAIVGGDFFAGVPEGGDRYLLSTVLHDWDDDRAVAILRSCRRALAPVARVLIIERVIPDDNSAPTARLRDLHMLVGNVGGRERTAREWRDLVAAADLRLDALTPVGPAYHAIAAVPA